ncbi:MAG: hypothetical protein A3J93_04380 [Candidatus Magasanikbacteria bacterium RIFOXYC2_FULL_42_28]|uniref:Uncharacterized protein n=1 Tax=Candidatus Magasanikbacteria bacterium RIFOXYC2_FULL_42_28 TaxID=1798704 RepID=A0A1F6NX06_9BACT|nr:MAG: hypothetical protein A3J93_04380 [Candidatus Magasanikbacteria bacterium RIFOXYC2_FULL_42_28]
MVRRNLDDIQIVEPPLEELTKQHSHKRGCFLSCVFIIFLIVSSVIGIRFYLGAGPQTIKAVPPNFPADIPLYDKNNIEQITFIPGQYKDRGLEIATFIPKILLAPFISRLSTGTTTAGVTETDSYWNGLRQVISRPPGDYHDTVQIEWRSIDADYGFIISYYKKELLKKNFIIETESEGQNTKQFSFKRDNASGSIYTRGHIDSLSGTEYLILTVNLP